MSIISPEHFGPAIQWAHQVTLLLFVKFLLSPSAIRLVADGPGSGNGYKRGKAEPMTVYPPCDTREMVRFSLQGRERVVLSVALYVDPFKDQISASDR